MTKYLYGKSVILNLGIPGIKGLFGKEAEEEPKEYVVFTDEQLYLPNDAHYHTCKIQNAEEYVNNESCTVPLAFLQVANDLTITRLIYLGLQLCSAPDGKNPICKLDALRKCAENLRGHRGRRKVLRALRYIREGSRSPIESIAYMFLRLPNAMGGQALRTLVFNYKILTRKGKTYYADLYIPKLKIILEYDSFERHNNAKSFSRDTIRQADLESNGYRVISIRSEQLYDLENFETLVYNITKAALKTIRIRARKFFEGFISLRDLLINQTPKIIDRAKQISLKQIPKFPGVQECYLCYLYALKKFRLYPDSKLTLTKKDYEEIEKLKKSHFWEFSIPDLSTLIL